MVMGIKMDWKGVSQNGHLDQRTLSPPQLYPYTPASPNKDFIFFVHGMDLNILDGGSFAQPMPREPRWKLKAAVQ